MSPSSSRQTICARDAGQGLSGPVDLWVEALTEWATDLGFDTFIFWPEEHQSGRSVFFAEEVVPRVLEDVNATRSTTGGTL
jgi:hypothetical protein